MKSLSMVMLKTITQIHLLMGHIHKVLFLNKKIRATVVGSMFLNADFFMYAEGHCILHMRYAAVYLDFHADTYMRFFIIFK
jgi:hypothetical protein